MVSMSDGSMARSSRASTRRRGLLLAIVLGAALQLAHAPQAFAAIAFVKNVGFLADNTTGTTTSVTVPVGGLAPAGGTIPVGHDRVLYTGPSQGTTGGYATAN